VDVGTGRQENLDDFTPALRCRPLQSHVAQGMDICAGCKQILDGLGATFHCRPLQCEIAQA
jgi:hypothetical protein